LVSALEERDELLSEFGLNFHLRPSTKVHDWAMEAAAWRLLFAAGKISLCSM